MSSYARPIVFVGQRFEHEIDAVQFLKEHQFFTAEECLYIEENIDSGDSNLEEAVSQKFKQFPSTETLNYVTDTGYFIGYTVAAYKTEDDMPGFLEDIKVAQEKWRELFKEDGIVCIEVQTS